MRGTNLMSPYLCQVYIFTFWQLQGGFAQMDKQTQLQCQQLLYHLSNDQITLVNCN